MVFVLAVNGAMETWIGYRGTNSSLTDAMHEKAEATAKRIEQSMAQMERQISWVTRASATRLDLAQEVEQHRADYAQVLNQVPSVNQLSLHHLHQGREQLRLSRLPVNYGSNVDFSRDVRFTETLARGTSFSPAYFRDQRPYGLDRAVAFRPQCRRHGGRDRSSISFNDYLGAMPRSAASGFAYVVDPQGPGAVESHQGPLTSAGRSRSCRRRRRWVAPGGAPAASGERHIRPCRC